MSHREDWASPLRMPLRFLSRVALDKRRALIGELWLVFSCINIFLCGCDEAVTKSPALPLAVLMTAIPLRQTSSTPHHPHVDFGRRYARHYCLVIHRRTQTGRKPLECCVCDRRFEEPSNLDKHLRTHGVRAVGRGEKGA